MRSGQSLVTEDLGPVGEFQVGSHDQGDPFVQGRAELEHQLGPGGGKGDEAQLIQHNELLFEGGRQEFVKTLLFLSQGKLIDQGGGIVETNPMTLTTGFQSQAGGDMTFAQAGIADEDNRLALLEVLTSGQVQDLGLIEPIARAVQEKGYDKPSPIQAKAIPVVLDGKGTCWRPGPDARRNHRARRLATIYPRVRSRV